MTRRSSRWRSHDTIAAHQSKRMMVVLEPKLEPPGPTASRHRASFPETPTTGWVKRKRSGNLMAARSGNPTLRSARSAASLGQCLRRSQGMPKVRSESHRDGMKHKSMTNIVKITLRLYPLLLEGDSSPDSQLSTGELPEKSPHPQPDRVH